MPNTMPSTFAGFEVISNTKNFMVTCDADPEARIRATNVGETCESDLAALNTLFSTNFEAGNTAKYTIWVHVLKDLPSSSNNGWNYGYETNQSSRIFLQRAFAPPPPAPPPPEPLPVPPLNFSRAVVEFPRFVFVAELAEILMQFTGYGWQAGNSMGEGLSNLLGALLHPEGYYTTGQGPRISPWLKGGGGPPANPPRADFVSTTVNTDKDIYSYGCAILFINYLVYQRGHSLQEVIRTGGGTLAELYERLIGQPAAAAYSVFDTILELHIGTSTPDALQRDNIFPLYTSDEQIVNIAPGDSVTLAISTAGVPKDFKVKPGLCAADKYPFNRQEELADVSVFAWAKGTANAEFRWTIAGLDANVRGTWTALDLDIEGTAQDPDGQIQPIAFPVRILYQVVDAWNASALYVRTDPANGNFSLEVTAAAREAWPPGAWGAKVSYPLDIVTVSWVPSQKFVDAQQHCNHYYTNLDDSIWNMILLLNDMRNRPDPPPDGALKQFTQVARELEKAVAQFAKSGRMTNAQVWNQIGRRAGLRSPFRSLSLVDLNKLRPVEKIKIT